MKKIFQTLSEIQTNYTTPVNIIDGLTFNQRRILRMCEFYSNSRYIGDNTSGLYNLGRLEDGNRDALNREIPFYNIVNYRVTLAKVATDLDIKDVRITSDDPKSNVKAMLLQHEAYEWMKAADFGLFLNRMGYTRPKYGGVLVKKSMEREEGKDELKVDVVEWKNVVTDQIDIERGNIVECHYMTPVDLMEKDGVWDNVREAVKYMTTSKKKYDRLEVYEVHGQFPKSVLNDALGEEDKEDDEYTYSKQRYFLGKAGEKEFIFLAEEFKDEVYKYLAWEEMSGRGLGRGVIEDSEQAQIWTNDSVQNERDAMELAGKVGVATTSKKLAGSILEHDNGRIYELEPNETLAPISFAPSALGEFQNQINRWTQQADNATSAYDANTGEQPPSGTPYSTTALLNQVASKPFDYRREEAGIFLSEIFEDWVIPYLIKKIKKEHILVSNYSKEELDIIDTDFATSEANNAVKESYMSGVPVYQESMDATIEKIKQDLITKQNNKRYIPIPDNYFDNINSKVTVITTNEQRDKAATLTSLSEIMKTIIGSMNPQTGEFMALKDPVLSKIFSQIITLSGATDTVTLGIGASQPNQTAPQQAQMSPQMPEMTGMAGQLPANQLTQ
jgi:hypothetical protein